MDILPSQTAVDFQGTGFLYDLLHVQIALPVVTGDIQAGDVGGLVRREELEEDRESYAFFARLVLSQLGHGLKGPAAVAGHADAYAHVLEEVVLPGVIADTDVREPEDLVVAQEAVACILEQNRVQAQVVLDNLAGVFLLH